MARSNENENENENEGTGSREGLFAGARYNTYKIAKHAFGAALGAGGIPRAPTFPGYQALGGWDAEDRGWIYLSDFVRLMPSWSELLGAVARATWNGWPPGSALDNALAQIIDAAGEREDRFAEILHQRNAEGCVSYWMTMLGIDAARHPNTVQLIRVARKLGEMVVMCLKNDFDAARPSQLCPAIVPMFDPPRTAAYPAGHSLQSYLISYFLLAAMPQMPHSKKPARDKWKSTAAVDQHEGLFALARRAADNRVIAGVHFDIDSEAGFAIACEIDSWLQQWIARTDAATKNFRDLLAAVKIEFPQFQ